MNKTATFEQVAWLTTGSIAEHYGVSRDTAWDWITKGVDTAAGRVKLCAVRMGGRWKTRAEWCEEFFRLCGGAAAAPVAETAAKAEARAKAEQAEAAKQLRGKKRR